LSDEPRVVRTRDADAEVSVPWESPGLFGVSSINYSAAVQDQYNFPNPLVIYDATIKRIGTTPGIRSFPVEAKVELARRLDDVGVAEIGVNPGWFTQSVWGDADLEGAEALCRAGLRLKVVAAMEDTRWIAGDYSYIDRTVDAGVNVIELALSALSWRMYRIPGPDEAPTLRATADLSPEEVDEAVGKALEYIRRRGLEAGVLFGPPLGTLQEVDALVAQMNRFIDRGADRFRMGDVSGTLNPEATRLVVRRILTNLTRQVRLTYIVHQPFGLGGAVAIAAAAAGAHPETHVNGFAHKGGASLEEVVLALELWYGVKTGIKLDGLAGLCTLVEEITGVPNHPYKPVVGPAMWAPSWGWQIRELLAGNDGLGTRMAPYNPEVVGARVNLVWSAACLEPRSIEAKLTQLGLDGRASVDAILNESHRRILAIESYPAWLSDAEVSQICHDLAR
jgi:isopropylmalate/homocitrate/citramalate synthase